MSLAAPSPPPAQVLNILAPIQVTRGDRAGAEQMLSSATTLAKARALRPCCAGCLCMQARVFLYGSYGSLQHSAAQRGSAPLLRTPPPVSINQPSPASSPLPSLNTCRPRVTS